ncbi:uncharacterized protein LOC116200848 isoform X2 [Punica granatum]|uniref:Uncharacterized protein LOC116200848 isoform X2 n=1 Tax=Punica granatum TaxID=22663 RepID=A0A6P8D8P3_PUNGR|nr:uncharacterized protein LOC116200848 isoform X2 [Punica granatum]
MKIRRKHPIFIPKEFLFVPLKLLCSSSPSPRNSLFNSAQLSSTGTSLSVDSSSAAVTESTRQRPKSHLVGVEGSDDGKFEDSEIEKFIYDTSPPKQAEDPVVYKLVRVEGDGSLVPATDDEIMEVADLLKDESIDMDIVNDNDKNMCITIEESSNATTLLESSGFLQCEKDETDAGNIDAMVQDSAVPLLDNSDARDIIRYSDAGECSNPPDPMGSELSPAAVSGSSKPDFSKLKGEICLDNLSIRELHETFRATFGRETTVKDKAWLKRRILMGLTNSCDVSATNFTIKDNKVPTTGNEGNSKKECSLAKFSGPVRAMDESNKSSAVENINYEEDSQVVSAKRLRSHVLVDSYKPDGTNQEEATAKRMRKPTRRYIEELSDVESRERTSRLTSSYRGSGQGSPQSYATKSVRSDSRTFVTRLDSFAGFQVPCVSRLRRSRPRKDVMSLMLVEESEIYGHTAVTNNTEGDQNTTQRDSGSSEDVSNDNVVTVPTAKGGMRRKHHRAWTLSEVMKLVDGVSRYGAGRWSEIKRLAFASYSYRTSVDLKDKWRNLLKAANFASAPTDLMNSRKHAVTPIPAPILSRVRELAERNGQASPSNVSSSKFGLSGRTPTGSAPGYL